MFLSKPVETSWQRWYYECSLLPSSLLGNFLLLLLQLVHPYRNSPIITPVYYFDKLICEKVIKTFNIVSEVTAYLKTFCRSSTSKAVCFRFRLTNFAFLLITSFSTSIQLVNPYSSNVSLMQKPGSWFLLAKCFKNACGRVTS